MANNSTDENNRLVLPDGSVRISREGYEEIRVPALEAKPLGSDEKIVSIASMPDWAQHAFKGMTEFNRVQSRVYETALFSEDNILLCAPTGAGKTNVAMLTILQQIASNRNLDGSIIHEDEDYKILYLAPTKAMVAEVVFNFSSRLHGYNVNVKEVSGDQTLTRQHIEETQIIVTTPEKWDIITRQSGDRTYTQLVKLLIIDDINLLHDSKSGPVLESIVARTIRQSNTFGEPIRLVGLSATLPNYEDVASFLRVDLKKGLFHFDNSYRYVPLSQLYVGITVKKPFQRFRLMNDICYKKVLAGAGKHQCFIFVHSGNETVKTARSIRDTAIANDSIDSFLKEGSESRKILASRVDLVESNDLKDLLPYGFAVHHAGISRADRLVVEQMFSDGHLQVLVSTATLAWGVNLSAHTVIIKGTQIYNPEKGAWTEQSPLDVMQMLGRADVDAQGEGIIITDHSELQYYLSLMNQQLPIESQFISKLADQLNAEIALGSVQNDREALNWLGYTYLYARMLRNPTLYGLPHDILSRDVLLKQTRADLVNSAATVLDKSNLVKYDKESGYFQVTDLGRIASYYYITHGTMATYNEHLKPTMGDIELCRLFSLSEEFKYVTVRQDEKMELAKLLDHVPIPIKESLEEPSAKINVLLQAYISQLKLEGLSLTLDMEYISESARRLVRALFEIALKSKWAQLAEKALNMSKMVNKRMWSVETPLWQFNVIPKKILMKLEKKDLAWERYYDLSAQEIGELICFPEVGNLIHKCIHQFPKLILKAHVQPITQTVLRLGLKIHPEFMWEDTVHGYVEPFWVIVEDNKGKCIVHQEYFMLKKQYHNVDHFLNFTVPIHKPLPPYYIIRVVSDRWLGSQTVIPVSFGYLLLPKKYPRPTELQNLPRFPVTALGNTSYEALYYKFELFNPVQTQVFTVLYNSDDNVLVAAPTGSGKTICAEFAILRNHQKGPETESVMRAVYIAPIEALAKERHRDWEAKFGKGLRLRVVQLTGETSTDLELLKEGQIIISTPEIWDALSCGWKLMKYKYVQQVSLFIIDELHLIGGQGGSVLEVIVSRMRHIACQTENNIRIVALATSLANAKDFGKWIGTTTHSLFNFPPRVRPVPLEIQIQGVDISNYGARMQAMTKPTYTAIKQHAKEGKPAIVFVPTRKHVRLTAVDLMAYSGVEGGEKPEFLLESSDKLKPFIEEINEELLKDTLSRGVGYLHKDLTSRDQEIVSDIFEAGLIQVCVMVSSMCWGIPLTAHLVIVMGTQYYDWRETAHPDYPVSDLLQMMGHAGRPNLDASGKCVVLCHSPRKEYHEKFLKEAFPVESCLQHYLHDYLNGEVVVGVRNKQDAVDFFTRTFMFQRLKQNPNYYNLLGESPNHLSEYISELLENTLSDLEASNCVTIRDDKDVYPLHLGKIAYYFNVSYTTVENFSKQLIGRTDMKGILKILSSASEYAQLPMRPGEEEDVISRLMNHQRFPFVNPICTSPDTKAIVLLQAHFSRYNVGGNLALDLREVLLYATRLLEALVFVIFSSNEVNSLNLAVLAMKLRQMVVQGMWERDSMLLQLPHFTEELANRCEENPNKSIKTVFDLMGLEDEERRRLLQMPDSQLLDIARFCKRFPNVKMTCKVMPGETNMILQVELERVMEGRTEVGPVDAPRYPKPKEEGWWLFVGDTTTNKLLTAKRVYLQRKSELKLSLALGQKSYTIYFMCDSYMGCDKKYNDSPYSCIACKDDI